MKLIIAGGRDFNNYTLLAKETAVFITDEINVTAEDVTIVSGTCRGADKLGELFAERVGYEVDKFPAQWKMHGRSADYRRNEQMAQSASHLIAFWDGKSRGTQHMINIANDHRLKVKVIHY